MSEELCKLRERVVSVVTKETYPIADHESSRPWRPAVLLRQHALVLFARRRRRGMTQRPLYLPTT